LQPGAKQQQSCTSDEEQQIETVTLYKEELGDDDAVVFSADERA